MEGIRPDEDAVLKTVGCKSLGGSSPSPSAILKKGFTMGIRIDIEWDFVSPSLGVASGTLKIWENNHDLQGPEKNTLILQCKCKKEKGCTGFSAIDKESGIESEKFKLFEEQIKTMMESYWQGMMLEKCTYHWIEETLENETRTFAQWSRTKGYKGA